VVEHASTPEGLAKIGALIVREEAERVVVGLPLTLRGERGSQAEETEVFVRTLRETISVSVETYDERFTTSLASKDGGEAPEDARAAAHLLESYLEWARTA